MTEGVRENMGVPDPNRIMSKLEEPLMIGDPHFGEIEAAQEYEMRVRVLSDGVWALADGWQFWVGEDRLKSWDRAHFELSQLSGKTPFHLRLPAREEVIKGKVEDMYVRVGALIAIVSLPQTAQDLSIGTGPRDIRIRITPSLKAPNGRDLGEGIDLVTCAPPGPGDTALRRPRPWAAPEAAFLAPHPQGDPKTAARRRGIAAARMVQPVSRN